MLQLSDKVFHGHGLLAAQAKATLAVLSVLNLRALPCEPRSAQPPCHHHLDGSVASLLLEVLEGPVLEVGPRQAAFDDTRLALLNVLPYSHARKD